MDGNFLLMLALAHYFFHHSIPISSLSLLGNSLGLCRILSRCDLPRWDFALHHWENNMEQIKPFMSAQDIIQTRHLESFS